MTSKDIVEEGVIQFQAQHTLEPLPSFLDDKVLELLAWRRLIFLLQGIGQDEKRYDGAGFGNVSLRTGPFPGRRGARGFLVTGTQTGRQPELSGADLAWVKSVESNVETVVSCGETKPSSESMTHSAIYDLGSQLRAVVHVHLPKIYACRRKLRMLSTSSSANYGTLAMVREVQRLQGSHPLLEKGAFTMEGHEDGVVVFGRSLDEAMATLLSLMADAEKVSLSS
ncbi:MAG: class II aldolase/adducin family protein [Deltaproteobacteria bacterium]|nr:class II aldolase/adducin family protein [Deltaproteobacteria bacterium]